MLQLCKTKCDQKQLILIEAIVLNGLTHYFYFLI